MRMNIATDDEICKVVHDDNKLLFESSQIL